MDVPVMAVDQMALHLAVVSPLLLSRLFDRLLQGCSQKLAFVNYQRAWCLLITCTRSGPYLLCHLEVFFGAKKRCLCLP